VPSFPSPEVASEPLSLGVEAPIAPEGATRGRTENLRGRAARGTLVNGVFLVVLNALGLVRGLIVAGFVGAATYGLWGLISAAFVTLFWLASVGIDDKYIQQDHADQEAAFQIAFTLQALLCAAFLATVVVALPLFALAYGRPEIIAPGLALGLAMPAIALQTPLWVHYRQMDFVRLRLLQSAEPLVSFALTVGLLLAGLDLWALVLGTLGGAWAAALIVGRSSPYPLAWRYERGALREYASFSWPLFASGASAVLVLQVPVAVASRALGIRAVGGMTLATNISQFTTRVDDVVTQTLYPAICAVKDRGDLLFEVFSKSNRIALLWAVPAGVGLALFAADLVPPLLGEKWRFAVPVIEIFGLMAAVNQIGFNWTAFFRARGETKPIAVANAVLLAGGLGVALPLLLSDGITGFATGMAVATTAGVLVRLRYLARVFPAFAVLRHIARGVVPTVPVALVVLGLRWAGASPGAAAEIAIFVALAAAATLVLERALLREALGYLGR
jgi:O-antigen/teichoic acid export membrane protein